MFFANADVTFFLNIKDGYKRIPVKNVYWEEYTKSSRNESILVMIPLHVISLPLMEDPLPEERHYLSKGITNIDLNNSSNLKSMIDSNKLFTIRKIKKVDQIVRLSHWEVGAE